VIAALALGLVHDTTLLQKVVLDLEHEQQGLLKICFILTISVTDIFRVHFSNIHFYVFFARGNLAL